MYNFSTAKCPYVRVKPLQIKDLQLYKKTLAFRDMGGSVQRYACIHTQVRSPPEINRPKNYFPRLFEVGIFVECRSISCRHENDERLTQNQPPHNICRSLGGTGYSPLGV